MGELAYRRLKEDIGLTDFFTELKIIGRAW
jgi:hypothetical protein